MRLICINGLMAPDDKGSILISVPHVEGVLEDFTFWLDHLEAFATAQDKTYTDLELMAHENREEEVEQLPLRPSAAGAEPEGPTVRDGGRS
jgi:hypothetical protein